LECVPSDLAGRITESIGVPTIGIGAGPRCDGQILVIHDMIGLKAEGSRTPRFVRKYACVGAVITDAVCRSEEDVRAGAIPSEAEPSAREGMEENVPTPIGLYR